MFVAILQLFDLVKLHHLQAFLLFFIVSWAVFIIKISVSATNWNEKWRDKKFNGKISVIIPIVDEEKDIWERVLNALEKALSKFEHEVVIVANGKNGRDNIELAETFGYKVIRLTEANKRKAIKVGTEYASGDITLILDSDTIVLKDSIKKLLNAFRDNKVGGATPRHIIFGRNRSIWTLVSDWLEDIRFNEVLAGQTKYRAVSCLPGRMLAVRTHLLKEMIDDMVHQKFLGAPCFSGDDRFLTSWLLEKGYSTVYVNDSIVLTNAPETFKKFVKQRLRWSRTSFRETLRSLGWSIKYPYTYFTVVSNSVMRWWFFGIIVLAILKWSKVINIPHYFDLSWYIVLGGIIIGFFISGTIRQIRHLSRFKMDWAYLPLFLIITTLILTPIEWYGNITLRESGWMTRDTQHEES